MDIPDQDAFIPREPNRHFTQTTDEHSQFSAIKEMNIMGNKIEEHVFDINITKNVLMGVLIGGLTGVAAVLLFAPQSGKRTRSEILRKSSQLRDRTTDMVNNAFAQVRYDTHEITADVREKAGQLKQLGEDKLVEQVDRVISAAIDAGMTAAEANYEVT